MIRSLTHKSDTYLKSFVFEALFLQGILAGFGDFFLQRNSLPVGQSAPSRPRPPGSPLEVLRSHPIASRNPIINVEIDTFYASGYLMGPSCTGRAFLAN
jgi:hypothetical protein